MSEPYRSLYSVIPARVRDDHSLRPNAKLLYGELSALAQAEGYCWASNAYLAEQLGVAAKTVEGLLRQLKDRGHIQLEVERSEETNEVLRRRIWICGPPGSSVPPPLKNEGRSPQNCGDPPLKIEERMLQENNTSNIPPYNPPRGMRSGAEKRDARKRSLSGSRTGLRASGTHTPVTRTGPRRWSSGILSPRTRSLWRSTPQRRSFCTRCPWA